MEGPVGGWFQVIRQNFWGMNRLVNLAASNSRMKGLTGFRRRFYAHSFKSGPVFLFDLSMDDWPLTGAVVAGACTHRPWGSMDD